MSDYYYKIIPESEVEPQKAKRAIKTLECCKRIFRELTKLDLPDFKFKWIRPMDRKAYEDDQVYFKLQESIDRMSQLIGSNEQSKPLEKKYLKNVDNFWGMFSRKLSGKDPVIYLRSDIPLSLISETMAHEFFHLASFVIRQKNSPIVKDGGAPEWMADKFAKNLLQKYPDLR